MAGKKAKFLAACAPLRANLLNHGPKSRAVVQFFQEHLEFKADKGESLKYLQERHAQYLEGVFDEDTNAVTDDNEVQEVAAD